MRSPQLDLGYGEHWCFYISVLLAKISGSYFRQMHLCILLMPFGSCLNQFITAQK